jgi:hypothetical protein
MNNPKEKAKELFNKYCYAIRTEETDSGYFTNVIYAKQCAIIAVDEIIDRLIWHTGVSDLGNTVLVDDIKYWREVKNELEKL